MGAGEQEPGLRGCKGRLMPAGGFAAEVVPTWGRQCGAIFPKHCLLWGKRAGAERAKERYRNTYQQGLVERICTGYAAHWDGNLVWVAQLQPNCAGRNKSCHSSSLLGPAMKVLVVLLAVAPREDKGASC